MIISMEINNEDKFIKRLAVVLIEEMKEYFPTKGEMNTRFNEMEERWDKQDIVNEEVLSSVKVLDKVLEQHPVPRIKRIESHLNLSPFVFDLEEELV